LREGRCEVRDEAASRDFSPPGGTAKQNSNGSHSLRAAQIVKFRSRCRRARSIFAARTMFHDPVIDAE
jgi:hypothetical protein